MKNENISLDYKAKVCFEKQVPVHIKFKENFWKNGYIKELSSDFFMLEEFKEGLMPIFYLEIREIIPYENKKRGMSDGRD